MFKLIKWMLYAHSDKPMLINSRAVNRFVGVSRIGLEI